MGINEFLRSMKRKPSFLICLLLFVGLFLLLVNGCKKDKTEGSFKDKRDGNVYRTVTIGNQIWMAENLRYLPSVVGSETGSFIKPHYYVYGYLGGISVTDAKATSNYTTYGVLYNWPAAMAGSASTTSNPSNVQGVCPKGWHLPSCTEWTQLTDYLGGESVAGNKLKEAGTNHWTSPNIGATNETGFTALPGGCVSDSMFRYIDGMGYWWSATEEYNGHATSLGMYYGNGGAGKGSYPEMYGFSIRCLRDN